MLGCNARLALAERRLLRPTGASLIALSTRFVASGKPAAQGLARAAKLPAIDLVAGAKHAQALANKLSLSTTRKLRARGPSHVAATEPAVQGLEIAVELALAMDTGALRG